MLADEGDSEGEGRVVTCTGAGRLQLANVVLEWGAGGKRKEGIKGGGGG